MVVLVCGAREFNDCELLFGVLDDLHRKTRLTEIIHGGAAGADALAGRLAPERGIYESTKVQRRRRTSLAEVAASAGNDRTYDSQRGFVDLEAPVAIDPRGAMV